MNIYKYDIVFQEVPGEISLAFYVCGCPFQCKGCHSPELWTEKSGETLTPDLYGQLLDRYQGYASCVLFMGGEWHLQQLKEFLKTAQDQKYKTALYTGLEEIPEFLGKNLDFVKLGPWRQERGGLSSPTTNQVFLDLSTKKILNNFFQHTS
jgi:anaerobic ribonucleoside-triphosphate reductase activating protein